MICIQQKTNLKPLGITNGPSGCNCLLSRIILSTQNQRSLVHTQPLVVGQHNLFLQFTTHGGRLGAKEKLCPTCKAIPTGDITISRPRIEEPAFTASPVSLSILVIVSKTSKLRRAETDLLPHPCF